MRRWTRDGGIVSPHDEDISSPPLLGEVNTLCGWERGTSDPHIQQGNNPVVGTALHR
jgi:hypothetical protein